MADREKPFGRIARQAGVEVRQWLPPDMSERRRPRADSEPSPTSAPPTAAQLEAIQQEAYKEGFEKGRHEGQETGHEEGVQQARREMQDYARRMQELLETFDEPLRDLDDQVEKELLNLVIVIVRQLVRREVKSDPNLIVGVVREALSILPVASRHVRLMLHPEDALLVREVYALGDTELGWELVEDPVINRGGCRVVTDSSQIDATLESRLASLIAPLLAGARALDEARERST